MDKILYKIIEDVAKNHSVDIQEVEKILNCPYKMMRDIIQDLELHGKSYDDVKDLKTNFNMPVLFKLYISEYKLNKLNNKLEENDRQQEEND